jgi:hypothetical protein
LTQDPPAAEQPPSAVQDVAPAEGLLIGDGFLDDSGITLGQTESDSGSASSARRGGRSGGGSSKLVLVAAAVVVLAAVCAVLWYLGPLRELSANLLGTDPGRADHVVSMPETQASSDADTVADPTPTAAQPETEPISQYQTDDAEVETTRLPTGPVAVDEPLFGPATGVESVTWRREESTTFVIIRGNGGFPEDRIRVGPMSSPPRVLVRLFRVETFPSYEIEVGTPEVAKVRMGYHPETDPPALYVVFDLADEGASLAGHSVEGDTIILSVASQ